MNRLLLAAVLLAPACVMNKLDTAPTTVELTGREGAPAVIAVEQGPSWTDVMRAGPLKFNLLPQIAVWAERPDGTFVETLYVTGAGYEVMKHAGKQEGEVFWRQCLPAWSHRVEAAGGVLPSDQSPYVDGVTSATPHASFTVHTTLPPEDLVLYAEVNRSSDHNAAFPEEVTDWVGQPSVVYSAPVPADGAARDLSPKGYGDPEAPGQVNADTSGLDTALHIVERIWITIE